MTDKLEYSEAWQGVKPFERVTETDWLRPSVFYHAEDVERARAADAQQIAALRAENEKLFKELAYHVDQRQQLEEMHNQAEAQLTALQAENEQLQKRNDNQFSIIQDFSFKLAALQTEDK